jgi:ABC-2 type transport system permease protein
MRVARKELWGFFASPVAYIFLGAFLAVDLFVFFWVETFFARNIADARPLFDWMPILLIFLVAALTMRMWSEERRAGTVETLMTLPVSPLRLVLGKFLAALGLVAVAVALTVPLPVTVSLLGPMDWGPVIGAYLATLLLAAAYIAIGLFISARTDNPIVSLIGTALVCGVFYLLGSNALTGLLGNQGAELLKLLGSGSRFESITRGVIDLRDLYFYLSIVAVFLALNVYTLERLRWAGDTSQVQRHRRWALVTALFALNFLAGNLWLQQIGWLRLDITQGHIYTISPATRKYLRELQEPLLIRGYFSAHTHRLLAPLVPQIRDLLEEYKVAGHGRVRVELVDPLENPDLQREAAEKYGIRPVAFETASKYQAGVVNSYFDILVKYGDQYEKLGFRDLIEVKQRGDSDIEVRLRNPEYDITRAIKKVLYGYQGGGDVFQNLSQPVAFHGFISSPAKLPAPLPKLRQDLESLLKELAKESNGKLTYDIKDPDAGNGDLAREIQDQYGFQPLVLGLLDQNTFYFYMMLQQGDHVLPLPLPEQTTKAGLKQAIEAGIKRFAPGYLKTIAMYTPDQGGGMMMGGGQGFTLLKEALRENAVVRDTTLEGGSVPSDADLLLMVGPKHLDRKQVFAMDQFLMQGGTVVLAASPYHVDLGGKAISARKEPTGLEDWLANAGVTLKPTLVLDPQNTPFPIPVQKQLGGFVVQEVQTLAYPYFPDIRGDGMSKTNGITASLGQLTLNWGSPIEVDAKKNQDRKVADLLESSADAWTNASADIQPDYDAYGLLGFAKGSDLGRRVLAVEVDGRFNSFFAGKPSPLLGEQGDKGKDAGKAEPAAADKNESDKSRQPVISGVMDTSPGYARLILIGSSSFLTDTAISLATEATGTLYKKPLELIQNAVDWSLEDRGLLALRGRGQYSRMLTPLDRSEQVFWEYLNYALALAGLALVYWLHRRGRARRQQHYEEVMTGGRT